MKAYKILNSQIFKNENYSIVPIRFEDRYDIMNWRNDQIYHLRQRKLLTKASQDKYFIEIVDKLFDSHKPDQLLFSFLRNEICLGYGGLVHMNLDDKHAEISFVMNTSLEKEYFYDFWYVYLNLIEEVAFDELGLIKIFVYAFDLRPKLYDVLIDSSYIKEARLKKHCLFNGKFIDVLIYSKFKNSENSNFNR